MRLPFFRSKATDAAADPAPRGRRGAGAAAGASAGPAGDDATLQALRLRARRRLVGALVLLVAGVLLFPLLFETQPRPLPGDTPILVPEGAATRPVGATPARPLPALPPDAGAESPATAAASAASPGVPASSTRAVAVLAGTPTGAAASAASRPAAARPAEPRVAEAPAMPARPAASKPTEPRAAEARSAEPKAAEPKAPEAASGRFVVQVGAYNDLERLKAARARLEKLGYKTYTQDVDTATGRRTRLRVTPVATRAEAEAIAAKVRGAGLQAAILSL